ncbi:MAG TPA: 2-C-methyl-D-erythritol 4-phosphate cytidylyltransferase [Mycobacteriales bacterium]|nr:2-C-methyl-D-erythritol 4-phosphate cytidylyltransferase [Mycobacteriales bacterium]
MTVAAVVPAAGRGQRLGGVVPKAFRQLGGAPLVVHAVRSLLASPYVGLVVVAVPADRVGELPKLVAGPVLAVPGGASRQDSVAAALAVLPSEVDVVLVHDAARPLVPVSVVDAVAAAVLAGAPAAVPVLPMVDTLKRVDAAGLVTATLPREPIRAVQTPQGFRREVLAAAHAAAGVAAAATDDAGLVERLGIAVHTVPGAAEALKITLPFDLLVAEAILRVRGHVG